MRQRYVRHKPEHTPLYPIIEEHAHRFFAELSEQGASLPGFCPPCSARRMVEPSAHLVDHVLPRVPVRQWVLSFPWPLRLLFAARPDVLNVVTRALSTAVLKRAGLSRSRGAQSGIVTFIQRFGSALNLNITCLFSCPTLATRSAMAQRDSTVRRHRSRARLNACSIASRGASLAPWCGPVCWLKIPNSLGSTWKREVHWSNSRQRRCVIALPWVGRPDARR